MAAQLIHKFQPENNSREGMEQYRHFPLFLVLLHIVCFLWSYHYLFYSFYNYIHVFLKILKFLPQCHLYDSYEFKNYTVYCIHVQYVIDSQFCILNFCKAFFSFSPWRGHEHAKIRKFVFIIIGFLFLFFQYSIQAEFLSSLFDVHVHVYSAYLSVYCIRL